MILRKIERRSTTSHSVENSLWKRLWTCRKKDDKNECNRKNFVDFLQYFLMSVYFLMINNIQNEYVAGKERLFFFFFTLAEVRAEDWKFVGMPLGVYLVVGIVIFLFIISHVSCGDMARSCDSSHVSAGRDDGTTYLLRQCFSVCVPVLLHGSHFPTKHARNYSIWTADGKATISRKKSCSYHFFS